MYSSITMANIAYIPGQGILEYSGKLLGWSFNYNVLCSCAPLRTLSRIVPKAFVLEVDTSLLLPTPM